MSDTPDMSENGNTQNLFDFDRDIYGQTLSVEILAWVRSEVKFSSLDNLKQQLAKDARRCRELLQASR